jgi:hypothetical protein
VNPSVANAGAPPALVAPASPNRLEARPEAPRTPTVSTAEPGQAQPGWDSAPSSGGVRPLREAAPLDAVPPEPRLPPEPARALPSAPISALDDDPRAARNYQADVHAYPSATAKKKDIAAATRKSRPLAPKTPRPSVPVDTDIEDVSPPAPSKKSNPLDLFNDTK